MDRYRKVQKTKAESVINENEIRITSQGFVRNYISYATALLQENDGREIVLKAMGPVINKAVAITEVIKRRIPQLHQDTVISSVNIVDVYEPIEEGLLPVETSRNVSMISITLSTKELNKNSPGYQAPATAEEVKQQQQSRTQRNYQQQQPPRQHNNQQRPRNNYQQQQTSRLQNNHQQEQPSKPRSNYQQQQPSRPQNNQQQQPLRPLNNYQQQQQLRTQNNYQQQSRAQNNYQQQPVARQARQSYDVADEDTYGRGRGGYRGRGRGRGWSRGGYGNYDGNNRGGGYGNYEGNNRGNYQGNYQGEGDGGARGRGRGGYGRSRGRMGSYARDDGYQRTSEATAAIKDTMQLSESAATKATQLSTMATKQLPTTAAEQLSATTTLKAAEQLSATATLKATEQLSATAAIKPSMPQNNFQQQPVARQSYDVADEGDIIKRNCLCSLYWVYILHLVSERGFVFPPPGGGEAAAGGGGAE
ncbi:Alba domain-containing protein [Heracleum sosnowskyi]|uniref:Alba domain-containing protein n=1 Tax=Heracleum sosnowskyi TaxID=360622 RepID=A0AAD8GXB1_9APIA|nr:Alba domain-containing protein [Heracleum sosnowskyi]